MISFVHFYLASYQYLALVLVFLILSYFVAVTSEDVCCCIRINVKLNIPCGTYLLCLQPLFVFSFFLNWHGRKNKNFIIIMLFLTFQVFGSRIRRNPFSETCPGHQTVKIQEMEQTGCRSYFSGGWMTCWNWEINDLWPKKICFIFLKISKLRFSWRKSRGIGSKN